MEDDKLAAYAEQLEATASKGRKGLGRGAELRVEGMREMLQKEKEEAFAQMSPREQDKCVLAWRVRQDASRCCSLLFFLFSCYFYFH